VAKTSWLQVTGQTPRSFKTKKAAGEAFTLELERLTADGWVKYWGTKASGTLVLRDPSTTNGYLALVISTVDADGYDLDGNRIRPELR
jgi:hypothetical protein